ncbi:MAG: type III secretion system inner membrane ring subunit SctD [Verrucomicrobia bacterium]|nr:type III secretion system inner membrane ring subunit SctD [Verrucomicrobiota bacterium]
MILRILNPPHTGAQAEIGPDPLTIGSGMDCDLILSDPLLQPEHCKVRLTGEGIEIELTGGAAHLDGEPVEKSPFTVRVGQVVTIGSTHMAFGEAAAVWDAVVIPTLRTLGGAAPAAMEVEAVDSSVRASAPASAKAAVAPHGLSQPVKIGIAVAASLTLVLILGLFFYNADQKRGMESIARSSGNANDFFQVDMYKTDADNQAADKVAERVKREVSGATVTGGERSGKAFLRIFVRTRAQANQVQQIVNASSVPVFTEIVSLEEIEKSAEMMASMKGFALDVTFAKDGTAYWKGYLPTPQDWKEVQDQIEKDLPYIKENTNNLTFAADIEKRANALLAEAGIKSPLAFQPLPREIIITGTMPENQTEVWAKLCTKLREEFGGILTFTDKVGSGKAVVVSKNPFHSPIVGVTLGSIPAVLLLDGQRIYEGTILKDGSVLTNISESDITLKGPEGTRSLPLNMDEALEKP